MKRSAVSSGRRKYPRVTPAPPMYNSPATPTGTGSPYASRMYTRAFAIGRPIGTDCGLNGMDTMVHARPHRSFARVRTR